MLIISNVSKTSNDPKFVAECPLKWKLLSGPVCCLNQLLNLNGQFESRKPTPPSAPPFCSLLKNATPYSLPHNSCHRRVAQHRSQVGTLGCQSAPPCSDPATASNNNLPWYQVSFLVTSHSTLTGQNIPHKSTVLQSTSHVSASLVDLLTSVFENYRAHEHRSAQLVLHNMSLAATPPFHISPLRPSS